MREQIAKFLRSEISTINRTLHSHRVDAGCRLKDTLVGGRSLILYRVRRGRGVRIADVEKLMPEISEALGERRGQRTPLRLQRAPVAIEAPHPSPAPIMLTNQVLFDTEPHTMICGRSYGHSGAQTEIVSLEGEPHTLIAGTTGAGKSVLMRNMLLSVAAVTSPADLRFVLIDLKNKDLRPLIGVPHSATFAHTKEQAAEAIAAVHYELERRMSERNAPYRLIVAIDELARLHEDKKSVALINDILATGRSESINVVAATQHPTKELLGKLSKVNFSVRLIGLVVDSTTAQVAAGRPATFAHMLPGRGAFLWIAGAEMQRFQSYYTDEKGFTHGVESVARQWANVRIDSKAHRAPETPQSEPTEPLMASLPTPPPKRDEIDEIADQIEDLWRDGASKNAMCRLVFNRNMAGSYSDKINRAIARLETREATTTTTTTTERSEASAPRGDENGSDRSVVVVAEKTVSARM